jgi:2-oxoglutarate ferredoxin oxidoreductase subunit beta
MTSPYGNIESSFDLCELVTTCGASYVARWTVAHPRNVIDSIKRGISKNGFAFIEILSQCPTHYGSRNRLGKGVEMMRWLKDNAIALQEAKKMDEKELHNKFTVGVFADRERPEWVSSLRTLSKMS